MEKNHPGRGVAVKRTFEKAVFIDHCGFITAYFCRNKRVMTKRLLRITIIREKSARIEMCDIMSATIVCYAA